jgi:trimeric autotransporter adhesin
MKHILMPSLLWAILSCYAINSNGQVGVTKVGQNVLVSNTASGIYNTGVGYNSLNANTTGNKNTGLGANTLRFTTNGIFNTASGYAALYFNQSGSYNAGYGLYSLFSNTTGSYNTAYGTYSLQANVGGYSNTAIGYTSLYSNTGSFNTATGYQSLYSNSSGTSNTAAGYRCLVNNSTGYNNTANGFGALTVNTTGFENTATGYDALFYNNGFANAAFGVKALYANTNGIANTAIGNNSLQNNIGASHNTAIGSSALYTNQSGNYNTATGDGSLFYNSTGFANTANGDGAMSLNSTGSFNTGVGYLALSANTTGSRNTAIGDSADVLTGGLTNATAIGYKAIVDRSNKVRVGNNLVTSIGGQVGWTTFSDGRYKNNINENVPGLTFINNLRPVTYTVNVKGLSEYYDKGGKKVNDNDIAGTEDNAGKAAIEKAADVAGKISYNGFVAQEVEAAAKKLNFDFSGVDKPENNGGLYGLRYDNFIAPLVKAVQELSQQNSELKKEVEELKLIVLSGNQTNKYTTTIADASFEQNVPNPFGNTTTIHYNLPRHYSSAKIIITDKNGKTLKEVNISGSGKGSVQIDSSLLSSGAYNYSLYINEKLAGTKQMLLAR